MASDPVVGSVVLGASDSTDYPRAIAEARAVREEQNRKRDEAEAVETTAIPSHGELVEMLKRIVSPPHYERLRAQMSISDFATDLRAELVARSKGSR